MDDCELISQISDDQIEAVLSDETASPFISDDQAESYIDDQSLIAEIDDDQAHIILETSLIQTVIKVVSPLPGDAFNLFSALIIGGLATGTVLSYLVPAGTKLRLIEIEGSGQNRSTMEVFQDATKIANKELYYGEFNPVAEFQDKDILEGETLQVKFTSNVNKSGNYTARVVGRLITL